MASLSNLWRWRRAPEPRAADHVTLRFCAKAALSVEAVYPDETVAVAGDLGRVAGWLRHHGYRYATGSSGVWVRA